MLRAAFICAGALLAAGQPAAAQLSHAAELTRVYDTILAARFDAVERQLETTCPPAPREGCLALRAAGLWWQVLMDPGRRDLDGALERASAAAIDAARAWTEREPDRAEAWFYFAAAHAPLVQWQVLRGHPLAAARAGSRVKSALERTLALDPTLHDAHFGIGLYRYYADVAPAAFRILRWLLLLPGGNRSEGLQQMLSARERGQLLRAEADFQLHRIYASYEDQPVRALELLRGLDARFPTNPLFLKRIAEITRDQLGDHPAVAAAWQRLADRARRGDAADADLTLATARLGLALELDAMFETDRAIDEILAVLRTEPARPHGVRARAHLQLGRAYDRLGRRAAAVAAYRSAIGHAPSDDYGRSIRDRANESLQRTPDQGVAAAYRVSLDGLRALEGGRPHDAAEHLTRAIRLNPVDPVARYRYARALEAIGDDESALEHLERLVAAGARVPPVARSGVFFTYGAMLERAGDRKRAIDFYRRARDVEGGAPDPRERAQEALTRLAR